VFAHDEALKFLEQARESAEALNRVDEIAAVDEAIGDIHEARGLIQPAVESYERALMKATTAPARAALKAKAGNAYVPIGDPRGLAYLDEAVAELNPKTQTNALALATALLGRYYHYRTEHRKAIEFLERAQQLAEPLDDPATLTNIYTYLAGAYQHLLLYDESDRLARATIALGERTKFVPAIAFGNEFLAENAAGRGHWDDTLAYAAKDAEEARKSGSLARGVWSEFSRVQALHGKGALAEGLEVTIAALELCEQIGEERLATWLGAMAAVIAADLGDDETARRHAERGWERARHLNQLVLLAWTLNALGYAAMQRGNVPAALECYEQYVPLVRDTENAVGRNVTMGRVAEGFLRVGRMKEAEQLVAQAIALAQFGGAPHYLALANRVQGQIFVAHKEDDHAMRAFDDAIAAFTKIGSRLELARALYHRSALLRDRGEDETWRVDAVRARDAFAAMGAVRDRALAEQLL
jgi:tetratricopeptide (TPR) repeat protein